MKAKKKDLVISNVIAFYLLMIGASTADHLSGKFFSPNLPVFSNFYANDFLVIGLMLFSAAGAVVASKILKLIKGRHWGYVFYFVVFLVLSIGFGSLSFSLTISGSDDIRTFSKLFDSWIDAFRFSCIMLPLGEILGIFPLEDKAEFTA